MWLYTCYPWTLVTWLAKIFYKYIPSPWLLCLFFSICSLIPATCFLLVAFSSVLCSFLLTGMYLKIFSFKQERGEIFIDLHSSTSPAWLWFVIRAVDNRWFAPVLSWSFAHLIVTSILIDWLIGKYESRQLPNKLVCRDQFLLI